MKKIFYDEEICGVNSEIKIIGNDYNHLANSLRVRSGESFVIGDKKNTEYIGIIKSIDKKIIIIDIMDYYKREKIRNITLILFFSLLKGDKNEDILRKCTEIGVDVFIPIISKNTITHISDNNFEKKLNRFKTVVKEASMQSLREKIPEIKPIINFKNINKYAINGVKLFGSIESKDYLLEIMMKNKNIDCYSLFVGPEGDFSNEEIDYLNQSGWKGVSFNSNILRSETAAIYFSSIVSFFLGGTNDKI